MPKEQEQEDQKPKKLPVPMYRAMLLYSDDGIMVEGLLVSTKAIFNDGGQISIDVTEAYFYPFLKLDINQQTNTAIKDFRVIKSKAHYLVINNMGHDVKVMGYSSKKFILVIKKEKLNYNTLYDFLTIEVSHRTKNCWGKQFKKNEACFSGNENRPTNKYRNTAIDYIKKDEIDKLVLLFQINHNILTGEINLETGNIHKEYIDKFLKQFKEELLEYKGRNLNLNININSIIHEISGRFFARFGVEDAKLLEYKDSIPNTTRGRWLDVYKDGPNRPHQANMYELIKLIHEARGYQHIELF